MQLTPGAKFFIKNVYEKYLDLGTSAVIEHTSIRKKSSISTVKYSLLKPIRNQKKKEEVMLI